MYARLAKARATHAGAFADRLGMVTGSAGLAGNGKLHGKPPKTG